MSRRRRALGAAIGIGVIGGASLAWTGCQSLAGFESEYHLATLGGDDGGQSADGPGANDAPVGPGTDGNGDDAPSDAPFFGSDAPFDASACTTGTIALSRVPLYMVIALDGSGSMSDANKWTSAVPALDAIFDDLKKRADVGYGVGLLVFSDSQDPTQGNGPYSLASPNVPIAYVDAPQATKLHARIDSASPGSSTPTIAVMSGMYSALRSFTPGAPLPPNGKRVLVLMTDGVPTDAPPDGGTSQQICVAMANAARTQDPPITTFVVGIGTFPSTDPNTFDPTFLGQLAQAGGSATPGCNPTETATASKLCYFQVTPGSQTAAQLEQSFVSALQSIRAEATPCDFTIALGTSFDPARANVVFDDPAGDAGGPQIIPLDPTNGWTFDNPTTPSQVTLHGASCAMARGAPEATTKLALGCYTQH